MTHSTIAILGAGNVGSTLGRRFVEQGHTVIFGLRVPHDSKYAMLDGERSRREDIASAVAHADLVLLATPWNATQDALLAAGDLTGKILIDATNPTGPGMVLTHGTTDSGAEQVSRWATGARVVKAFNSIGREVMANATFGEADSPQPALMFICGDDPVACDTVAQLASDIGFNAVRLGALVRARLIEPAALMWITATSAFGTREFAFGLLRRAS